MEISINDHGSFGRVGRSLRDVARHIDEELTRATERAADQVTQDVRRSAVRILPSRGGLARDVSNMTVRIERRSGGVRLVATSSYNLQRLDDGFITHPVYGNQNVQVTQRIDPGFWKRAIEHAQPLLDRQGERALEDLKRRTERG